MRALLIVAAVIFGGWAVGKVLRAKPWRKYRGGCNCGRGSCEGA